VLAKRIRRGELTRAERDVVLKELKQLPLQRHADDRLFPAAYQLALDTQRSLYDCLYLALAEAVDGR
jgi:predicted nucleic acid-binding protein